MSFGVNICEDIYYSSGPTKSQAILGGAKLIINISASPYHVGKIEEREKILFTRAVDNRVNIMYVNLVGGQDELVFDGGSLIVDAARRHMTTGYVRLDPGVRLHGKLAKRWRLWINVSTSELTSQRNAS